MRHRVSMPEPHSHLFHVEAELERPGDAPVFAMPVWTPGSYLVREFARHVEGLQATDDAGQRLEVERLDKARWKVHARGAARVRLSYRVYANDLTVRTSHLDGTHGYFNGANLFLCAEGRSAERQVLEVTAPPGWRVATALQGDEGQRGPFGAGDADGGGGTWSFEARDFDELVDSPVEVGTHSVWRFEAAGKPHAIALWGRAAGGLDAERLTADVKRIVESEAALMGGLPYARYLFIVHVSDKRRGGRNAFAGRDAYEETLALVAHEFFHVWNVKGLRPAALVPYDYGREQYTRLLWWFEGVTSYYDMLTLARCGLADGRRYLRHVGEALTSLERTPGAQKVSAEESSFTAWVKLYRADENTPNSTISYYLKGELVALALDLRLRSAGRSLDELLRTLWQRHAANGGVPEDGVERAVEDVLGPDATRAFFERHVRGPGDVDLPLDLVGVRLNRRAAQGFDDKGGTPAKGNGPQKVAGWLGAQLGTGPKLTVSAVREGSPSWRAGLYAEDEIVAEDGFRVDKGALWDRLQERGPGGALKLTVFRRDELVDVPVTLGEPPQDTVWLEPDPGATPQQRAAFTAWCGAAFPT
jgi:predicted metalloprotease with PDZ domain